MRRVTSAPRTSLAERIAERIGVRIAADRIAGVDVARGVALIGMFVAHLLPGDEETLADGRSSVLFATLAGVSLGLMTGGARPTGAGERGRAAASIALRGLILIVLGLLLWTLDSGIAIILDYYGVFFLVLLPVLFAPRAVLLPLALAVATVGAAVLATAPDDPRILTGGNVWLYFPAEWFVAGYYPGLLWLAYPLVGLAVARADLRKRRTQLIAVGIGAVASLLGYGGALLLGADAEAHSDTVWEAFGAGGLAVAMLGLLLLATSVRAVGYALFPLAAAGAMPLSLYTGQILAIAALEAAAGPGGVADEHASSLLVALIVGGVVLATAWRLLLGKGPLERLMAVATHRPTR
ncbi:MAG: hypothetical protein JWP66_1605 [Naasia sp.]|nr:hypothetical protein [Naasia sp.]